MIVKTAVSVFILLFCLQLIAPPKAGAQQKLGLEPDKWAKILSNATLNEVNSLGSLTTQLVQADSTRGIRFLDSLKASKHASGYYFKTFYCMVKADYMSVKFAGYDKFKEGNSNAPEAIKKQILDLYADALDAVYHLENDVLTGWVCFYSAKRMRFFGNTSRAVMYSKNGVDLFEQGKYPVEPPVYTDLAELLYQVEEYGEAMMYAKKGIIAWNNPNHQKEYPDAHIYKIKALNIIGNSFFRSQLPDSATVYYRQALQLATLHKDTLLKAHVMGHNGRILYAKQQYDSALALFKYDYQRSKQDSAYSEAANALVWMANTRLALGQETTALAAAREANQLLSTWPNGPYLAETYHTLTRVFRNLGKYDSAFYYNDHYLALHDSLEKEVATSSLEISRARLNDEVSRLNIQKINRERQSEIWWRNIIIGFILLGAVLALLITNRQRLHEKLKTETALQQKKMIEQEMNAANEQLHMFTANIVEKTSLIEKLELQLSSREMDTDQQAIIAELTRQTILTEDDWNLFKNLLEKLYPGFFHRLKEQYTGITLAEQRMAAMLKLRLSTRETAAMLGISIDSARKTRQRLKARLNLSNDTNLEEYVAGL